MPLCPTCNARFDDGTFCPKDGTALIPDGEELQSLVGQVIGGRYRLTKLLGQGGMGEVYAAEHVHITKKVAVKVLHPEIGGNPEALARFRQEAQSASSIGHENIVAIDDFGQMDDGRFYLCMEFLDGTALSDAMQEPGGLDPMRALDVMVQVCDGLESAHDKGIVHRDMKPENVFLTTSPDGKEVAKILDFGIAKVSGTDENSNLTKTGTVFGTPHYMSPEQALGQKVDQRADVYSVGVMLFEIFTGQVPFKAESFMGILSQHITKQPPQPSTVTPGRTIPRPIEDVILKAMSKDPEGRYSTVTEMSAALKAVQQEASLGAVAPLAQVPATPQGEIPATVAPTGPASGVVVDSAAMAAASSSTPIPKTMMASQDQVPVVHSPTGGGSVPVVGPSPTPVPVVPSPTPGAQKGKSKTGLIVGVIAGVVILGGGGAAAAIFWDDIMGNTPDEPVAGNETKADAGATAEPAATPDTGVAQAEPDAAAAGGDDATKVAMRGADDPPDDPPDDPRPAVIGKRPPKKQQPKDPPKHAVAKDPPKHAVAKDPPKKQPKDSPAKVVPTKVAPPPKPKKSHYMLKLVSRPSGASIINSSGIRVGRTPKSFKLKPGERRTFTIAKGGWKDRKVTIVGGEEDKTQTLRLRKGTSRKTLGIPGSDPF